MAEEVRVVIEGPDGAGKTTLAADLAERYHLDTVHTRAAPTVVDPLHYYMRRFLNHPDTVFDRMALSECVYGPLLRGTNRLTADGYDIFVNLLQRWHVPTILCLPPWETCQENSPHGDELINDDALFRRTYDRWVTAAMFLDVTTYDYTSDAVASVYDVVDDSAFPQLERKIRL